MLRLLVILALLAPVSAFAHPSSGGDPNAKAPCERDGSFEDWMDGVVREAKTAGVSQSTIDNAMDEMVIDSDVISRDRAQGVFQQSWLQFSDRMASADRIQTGKRMMTKHKALFDRIEQTYGVPAQVLISFWALETDFGSDTGKFPVLTSMTTLAYDCRRAAYFRNELIHTLLLIQRGDLRQSEMIGEWAGELGGMQFSPSDYYKYAVDFDGDGRRNLVKSIPDMMASAANFLVALGWQRGQPWLQEVRVPAQMPWDQADLEIKLPRSQWAQWGVKFPSAPLTADDQLASLILPMGRLGPAFLAYPSFQAYLGWNSAMVYSITAAYLSTRIAGAPAVGRGNGTVQVLSAQQVKELQTQLTRVGYSVGVIDGKLGLATRKAIKQAQMRLGLPADSYPTVELIEKLRLL